MPLDYRRLMVPALLALAGLASAALFWIAVQSSFRFALWGAVSEWKTTSVELRRLDECRSAGWWTWLKVVARDRTMRCGEVWAVHTLSDKVRGADRAEWLQDWVASAESSPLRKLRSALALSIAGRPSPLEPAWLSLDPGLPDLPGPGFAEAVAQDRAWGVHLGPRWMAVGELWAMSESGLPPEEAVLPLEAVWALGEPELERIAVSAVARGLGAPSDLPDDVRYRRKRGLPAGNLPPGWAEVIQSRPGCASPCLELWIELLRLEAAGVDGEPPNDPEPSSTLEPLASLLGYTGARGRALEWWHRAATRWVSAAPDPAARLASLGLGSQEGVPDPLAAFWDRGATPWVAASVLVEVGRRSGIPVEIWADETGALWASAGDKTVRGAVCGATAGAKRPDGESLPQVSLHAGALAEAAAAAAAAQDRAGAVRLATAAQRLDPILASDLMARLVADVDLPEATRRGLVIGAELGSGASSAVDRAVAVRQGLAPQLGAPCRSP